MSLSHEEILEMLESIAQEVDGEVRDNYSGRGMYGATCYAITTDDYIGCLEAAGAAGLNGASVDNMGKGYVIYWRHLKRNE